MCPWCVCLHKEKNNGETKVITTAKVTSGSCDKTFGVETGKIGSACTRGKKGRGDVIKCAKGMLMWGTRNQGHGAKLRQTKVPDRYQETASWM